MNAPGPPATPRPAPPRFSRLMSPTGLAMAGLCMITLAFFHGLWMPGLFAWTD